MSNLVKHAERELFRAGLFDKDADYGGMIGHYKSVKYALAALRRHRLMGRGE